MKKLFLTLTLLFGLMITANAQEVGKMWIGGTASFKSVKAGDAKATTDYGIVPEFGYMLSDNMGLGISLGYRHTEGLGTPDAEGVATMNKANGFEVKPFLRYNVLKGSIGGVFIDGGVGYSHLKAGEVKTNMIEVGLRPGASINIADNVSFIGKFGFLGYKNTKVGDFKTDEFGLDLNLAKNIELGIIFLF